MISLKHWGIFDLGPWHSKYTGMVVKELDNSWTNERDKFVRFAHGYNGRTPTNEPCAALQYHEYVIGRH